jgi:hypothetical protein
MITTIVSADAATREAYAVLGPLGLADMIVQSRNGRMDGPTITTVSPRRWHSRDAMIAAMQRLRELPGTESTWVNGGVIHLARR